MRILLDADTFVWLQIRPERLGSHLDMVSDRANHLFFSVVSAWELTINYARARLGLPEPPSIWIPSRMFAVKARQLPIEHGHAFEVAALPSIHGDPFDRLLVAQARVEDITIMTSDALIPQYPVNTLRDACSP